MRNSVSSYEIAFFSGKTHGILEQKRLIVHVGVAEGHDVVDDHIDHKVPVTRENSAQQIQKGRKLITVGDRRRSKFER